MEMNAMFGEPANRHRIQRGHGMNLVSGKTERKEKMSADRCEGLWFARDDYDSIHASLSQAGLPPRKRYRLL
jgi:hypothetical protein